MQRKTKRRPDAFAAERRRAAPYTRPDKISASMFPLVRATHGNGLRSRERRFESCRGTAQRHKFEHSDNLGGAEARASGLRRCGRAPELVPDMCPESAADEQVSPAQADWRSRSPDRSVTSGRCSCAYAARLRPPRRSARVRRRIGVIGRSGRRLERRPAGGTESLMSMLTVPLNSVRPPVAPVNGAGPI
jgi:hypothetical protein